MFHSLALLSLSAHPQLSQKRLAIGAMAVGSALFSGSIYAMVLLKNKGLNVKALAPVTPIGGIS